ncbi:MAG: ATP synthase F1 subunit epsilon [Nannocystaceae bacterium]
MSARAVMQVLVSTPAGPYIVDDVIRLRLPAPDGARGVLPGHERARFGVLPGPLVLVCEGPDGEHEHYLATEGGVASVDPRRVLLVCRWAAAASTLDALREQVAARRATRATAEQRARTVAHRHEMATRRALAELRREVGR